ncbi:hypothetical protein PG996_013101 [Apiospora saccharicola]|uniref:C3H1-type domain-containing protein n=1 Tax=Apiospora saccharicola TaxID=335842 RepID=A0ABR1U4I1_9PEZI
MTRRRNGGSFNHRAPDRWPAARPSNPNNPFGPQEYQEYQEYQPPTLFGGSQQGDSYRPNAGGKPQRECNFWKKGDCKFGGKCKFAHPPRTRDNLNRWALEELEELDNRYNKPAAGPARLPQSSLWRDIPLRC